MYDKELILRDGTSDLTGADETTTASYSKDFGGPDHVPITYELHVPEAGGTTPTLDVSIYESDDNSTWRKVLSYPQITAVGIYRVTGKLDGRYRSYNAVTGGTSPDFGAVKLFPVLGGQYTSF